MVETTGLKDFIQLWEDTPPFAVLAVKAKAGHVAAAMADTFDLQDLVEEPTRKGEVCNPQADGWASVVQLREDSWTYVTWAIGNIPPSLQGGLYQFAQDLSTTLDTESLMLIARAPSLWETLEEMEQGPYTAYRVFVEGQVTEEAILDHEGRVRSFECADEERKAPAGESDLDILEQVLAERHLYLPACAPDLDGDKRVLAVHGVDPGRLERADLFEGFFTLPAEEDTLDLLIDEHRNRLGMARDKVSREKGSQSAPDSATAKDESNDDEPLGTFGRFGRWVGGVLGRR